MKKYLILLVLALSVTAFAQNIKPKYEIKGNLIKVTYFYDNGQIMQEGFYKNGKVLGKWTSYIETVAKNTVGDYNNGYKIGKWFFWW